MLAYGSISRAPNAVPKTTTYVMRMVEYNIVHPEVYLVEEASGEEVTPFSLLVEQASLYQERL